MILDKIVESSKIRAGRLAGIEEELRKQACEMADSEQEHYPFEEELGKPGIHVICEVKKASPSKGLIAEHFDYRNIAKEYEEAGAAAISVLTEPEFFKGSLSYLDEIKKEVSVPLLRKDFIVDKAQIYEAKIHGASAVLLICAVLDDKTLAEYLSICRRLHLSALVEAHDEEEVARALRAKARIIGVNNRNLKDFTVDIANSIRLRGLVPKEVLFIAESGIQGPEEIRRLKDAGVNGVLIGETMMRAADKKRKLYELLTD